MQKIPNIALQPHIHDHRHQNMMTCISLKYQIQVIDRSINRYWNADARYQRIPHNAALQFIASFLNMICGKWLSSAVIHRLSGSQMSPAAPLFLGRSQCLSPGSHSALAMLVQPTCVLLLYVSGQLSSDHELLLVVFTIQLCMESTPRSRISTHFIHECPFSSAPTFKCFLYFSQLSCAVVADGTLWLQQYKFPHRI